MTTKIKINDIASLEKLNVVNRNSGVFVELPIYKDDLLNPYNDSVQNVKAIKSLKQIVEKVIHNNHLKKDNQDKDRDLGLSLEKKEK